MVWERYGLQNNPFGGNLLKPLDSPVLLDHYVTVEGFAEKRPEVDTWGQGQITEPQFFLVYGPKGTGRTSVANYIADKFPTDNKHLRVMHEIGDDNHFLAFHQWMNKLFEKAQRINIPFTDNLKTRFNSEIKNGPMPIKDPTTYYSILYGIIKEIKPYARLVAIFDKIRNKEIFDLAKKVFAPADDDPHQDHMLVIFTMGVSKIDNETDDMLLTDFHKIFSTVPNPLSLIALRPLCGADVVELISQRWAQFQGHTPHPFDEQTVKEIFDTRRYPIQRAVMALHYILDQKVKTLALGGDLPESSSLTINALEFYRKFVDFESKYSLI